MRQQSLSVEPISCENHVPGIAPPKLSAKFFCTVIVIRKALMKMTDEEKLLRRAGAILECPDTGCCGMAGPFGFEKENSYVAQAVGERVLLPAVRSAAPDTLIVADGFSCREQIQQSTGRTRNAFSRCSPPRLCELIRHGERLRLPPILGNGGGK